MSDEEKKASEEQQEGAETPVEEPVAEAADDAPAEEPTPDEAPPDDAPKPAADASPAKGDDAEDEGELGPKGARKLERARHTGEARPARSPEERRAERAEQRAQKAAARQRWRKRRREKRAASPTVTTPSAPADHDKPRPRIRQGIVVSDKADKTITVRIDTARQHRVYEKIVRDSSTLHAHDERNEANAGDTVRIVESRPLSRLKRWRLVEVVEKAR